MSAIAVIHWAALIVCCVLAFRYFRAMGDVTQAVFNVTRDQLVSAAGYERRTLAIISGCAAVALASHITTGTGDVAVMAGLVTVTCVMVAFTWLWVHVGLRSQQSSARYFDIDQAGLVLADDDSVLVVVAEGQGWAFPDREIRRPHIAGVPVSTGDRPVMTYCALSRLGLAVRPTENSRQTDWSVVGQHGNNLILKTEDRCMQQIYLGLSGIGDQAWRRLPVVRMSWRGFCSTYPTGQVYLNPMVPWTTNPLLRAFDEAIERIFDAALSTHHHSDNLMFETLCHEDGRLPRKTLVWGISIGDSAAAFTADYVRARGVVNVEVGGVPIVLMCDDELDSLVAFKRPAQTCIRQLDFHGHSDVGPLPRVTTFYPGMYWFAWCNFFPHTTLDDQDVVASPKDRVARIFATDSR